MTANTNPIEMRGADRYEVAIAVNGVTLAECPLGICWTHPALITTSTAGRQTIRNALQRVGVAHYGMATITRIVTFAATLGQHETRTVEQRVRLPATSTPEQIIAAMLDPEEKDVWMEGRVSEEPGPTFFDGPILNLDTNDTIAAAPQERAVLLAPHERALIAYQDVILSTFKVMLDQEHDTDDEEQAVFRALIEDVVAAISPVPSTPPPSADPCTPAPAMSFDDWRAARVWHEDLGVPLEDIALSGGYGGPAARGYVYPGGLYIEQSDGGKWVLTIANVITRSLSISELERRLYEWAVSEGMLPEGEG